MSAWTLVLRGVRFYWRTHLGVILGAALGALVLTGALLVGDSVKATLVRQALARVGNAESAVLSGDRFFRSELANEIGSEAAPVLLLRGSIARGDGTARVNNAQVLGVDARFWKLAPQPASAPPEGFAVNRRLATQLGIKVGDALVLRVEKPGVFSRDAPLSGEENEVVAIRLPVGSVVEDDAFGRFGLQASQVPPSSVFLPLGELQKRLAFPHRANLLLSVERLEQVTAAVRAHWALPDAGLELRKLETGGIELRTPHVFLDQVVKQAAPAGLSALTYLVNELRSGAKSAPYSMVTALDPAAAGFLPPDLAGDQIVINRWLADDLGIEPGAKLALKFFVMGERRQLVEQTREFTVRAVLPMETPQLDRSWMPDFPGLSEVESNRDWQPGFAIDNSRIRDQDEAYWKKYRGTPKAFVSLAAGQEMWGNRWGDLTAIRYPAESAADVETHLRSALTPEKIGMNFLPLRAQALAATKAPVDFGELFVSFSFFLIVAAAVLTGMLFVFALEQRNAEAGLLLALGWRPRAVRRLFLAEGAVLALLGSVLGAAGAVVYTKLVLHALATIWRGAVGAVDFAFAPQPATLAIGVLSGVLIALLAMWFASRRQLRHSARELLGGELAGSESAGQGSRTFWARLRPWIAPACLLLAVTLTLISNGSPELFFGAGALLLLSGIFLVLSVLGKRAFRGELVRLEQLGRRNAARRRGRSLATIAVLASGVFMVVAVDSFRHGPPPATLPRNSGTGGFALIGEAALPIYDDLNQAPGRAAFALDEAKLRGVTFVPMRVREGDDASCLNLNRALEPRLLGARAAELTERGAFSFAAPKDATWQALESDAGPGIVPGVVDSATLQWALQMKLGQDLTYTDERGEAFKVRLVASLAGSVLQGSVLISERHFTERFPGRAGYRFFLIDAPAEAAAGVRAELSRGLQDRGLELTEARQRLAEFHAVENTYLAIFQVLGGLGLLLGSAGLAIVVARNVLERRREFGLLEALGFRPRQLRQLVFAEHRWLILNGLGIGAGSALLAVWPNLRERANGFPWLEMALLLAALLCGCLFWAWAATRLALRGTGLAALRSE